MKYIKTYEYVKIDYDNINKGDYVMITCDDYNIKKEIMIVHSKQTKRHGYTIDVHKIDDTIKDGYRYTIFDYEIVKKISQEDAELYINTKKYNL